MPHLLGREEVMYLMGSSMNWVAQMCGEIEEALGKEEYAKVVEQHFGKETLDFLLDRKSVTFIEYSERCQEISTTLFQWLRSDDARMCRELEDVLFWVDEIHRTCESICKLVSALGYGYGVEQIVNELGNRHVDFKR
jgi:NTP pyrophosphatase (non-canonical NTP hydrolase)